MISQDKKEKERSDAKNAVEEYVYDMRGKLDGGEYEKYADDRNRKKLLQDLRAAEDWLYDQGASQEKTVYLDRLKSLKVRSDGDLSLSRSSPMLDLEHRRSDPTALSRSRESSVLSAGVSQILAKDR